MGIAIEATLIEVSVDTYSAYSVNLTNDVYPVTHYTNYPFVDILRFGDVYYGVADDGLYLIGGSTDDGVNITWSWRTFSSALGNSMLKSIANVYIAADIDGDVTLLINNTFEYAYSSSSEYSKNHRFILGRGLRERYYEIGMYGYADISIDMIEFKPNLLGRRL